MRINQDSLAYLNGATFSNGHRFAVDPARPVDRNALLCSLVSGKTVLHVGCADHIELIAEKRRLGIYLHDLLAESASRVIGSDIDRLALQRMSEIGIRDLYHPAEVPNDVELDVVLAPDVIEHVPNVGQFLEGLSKYGCDVVLTTPNALGLACRTALRTELINSDHRYWFSPYTLAKTVVSAGYEIRDMWYTGTFAKRRPLRSLIQRHFPLSRDGLAIRATPRD